VIQAGETVVVDIGGTMPDGYCSDSTRNYSLGAPPAEYAEYYAVLLAAQKAQCEAVKPGITSEELDAVGRDLIAAAGHGEHFIHRTGHGIGLETHEEPYIVSGSKRPLEPGMAFSIEPGIYLAGRHGARIEDIAICTETGGERLNLTPREARGGGRLMAAVERALPNDEAVALMQLVQDLSTRELAPRAAQYEAEERFPREIFHDARCGRAARTALPGGVRRRRPALRGLPPGRRAAGQQLASPSASACRSTPCPATRWPTTARTSRRRCGSRT